MYMQVTRIQATYIRVVDADGAQDEEAKFQTRLEAARAVATNIDRTMKALEALAMGNSVPHQAGVEHMCFMAGVSIPLARFDCM